MIIESPIVITEGRSGRHSPVASNTCRRNSTSRSASLTTTHRSFFHLILGLMSGWQSIIVGSQIEQLNSAPVPSALKICLEPCPHNLQCLLLRQHPLAQ